MLTKLYICVAAALTKSDAQNEKLPNSRITGWDTVRFAVTVRDICGTHFVKILHCCCQCFFLIPLCALASVPHCVYGLSHIWALQWPKNIKKSQNSIFTINATYLLKFCWNMVETPQRTSRLSSLIHFPDKCCQEENQTMKLKKRPLSDHISTKDQTKRGLKLTILR